MSEVRVAFDASVSPGVIGYRIYWGHAPLVYDAIGSPKDIGNALVGGIDIDETRTWYIAATAYDVTFESVKSVELVAALVLGCVTGRAN